MNDFGKTMSKEIVCCEKKTYWLIMIRTYPPPFPGAKTILAIWSLKYNIFPDGRIQKYKARFCACGGM